MGSGRPDGSGDRGTPLGAAADAGEADGSVPSRPVPMLGLDGAFLAFESHTMHLHLAGVLVFDPSGVPGGLSFPRIRAHIAERVPLVPPFRRRPVEVPFGLQHASLVDDPDFDLDYHVRRVSVPRPGGPDELAALVADLAGRPLDRTRPLWEFHVVEGLEHGHLALVAKVHHSIIDGVSGAEILAAFFDLDPGDGAEAPAERAEEERWSPPPVPGDVDRLRSALGSLPGQRDRVGRTVGATVRTARSLSSRNRDVQGELPPTPFRVPRTSINRAISPHRRVRFAEVPLAGVERVRQVLGGTINDVVLAMVAGALRTLFESRHERPDGSLVAMVPVSIRSEADRRALGNQVAPLLVSLATEVEDPVERLRLIRSGMGVAKDQHRTVGSEFYSEWAQSLFPAVATRLSRLLSNFRVFDRLPPVYNVLVSNIPGPDFPLYLAGARLEAMYPVGPIIEGAGLNITVFSYLQTLFVGVLGCWDLVPDIEVVSHGLVDALNELVKEADRRDRPVPWWHGELPT